MTDPRFSSGSDRRWLLGYAAFLSLLTLLPYALAFWNMDPDQVFTGFLIGVDDGNSYLAKMLAGANGAWLFRTPYSTFPQNGLWFVFLPYLLLGKLAAGPEIHLQLIALFQLFRTVSIFLLVFALYDFSGLFLPSQAARRAAVVLATAGGGLGWLLVLFGRAGWLGSLPLDFYSPETFGFLAVFGLPHLAAGRALMLWGLVVFLRDMTQADRGHMPGLKTGLLWLGSGLFSPINPAIAWLVSGVFLAAVSFAEGKLPGRRVIRTTGFAMLVSAPVVLYSFLASFLDPFFVEWTVQNRILSPHPLHYLLAYGLYLPWAVIGGVRFFRRGAGISWLPLVWVLLVPLLAYAPFNLQRRLPEGAFVALVILALAGIESGEGRLSRRSLGLLLPGVLTSVFLLAGSVGAALAPAPPVFRPAAETAAFAYLAEHAPAGAVVLAPAGTSNALPAFTPQRVVIGHGPETIGVDRLVPLVSAYFAGTLEPADVSVLLQAEGVDYVLGPDTTPAPPGGTQVYTAQGYVIYRVDQ